MPFINKPGIIYSFLYISVVSSIAVTQDFMDQNLTSVPETMILKNVSILNLSKNKLQSLNSYTFQELEDITELYLGDNNISYISSMAFYGLHKIRKLNLSHNALHHLPDLRNLSRSLQYLYLENNNINQLNSEYLNLSSLIVLDLDNNLLNELTITVQLNELQAIYMKNNGLKQFPKFEIVLPNLRTLDLSHNKIAGNLSCDYIDNIPMLQYFRVQYNRINDAAFCSRHPLYSIDIRNNDLKETPALDDVLPNLRYFYLGRNIFSYIDENYFSETPNLYHLHISDTGINALPDVSVLTSLTSLAASYNNLQSITTEQLKDLRLLSSISLYFNDLSDIPNFGELARSSQSSTLYVSLDGNSLHCGSDLCWLKEISQRYMFSDLFHFQFKFPITISDCVRITQR